MYNLITDLEVVDNSRYLGSVIDNILSIEANTETPAAVIFVTQNERIHSRCEFFFAFTTTYPEYDGM